MNQRLWRVVLCAMAFLGLVCGRARAQYIFLDSDGDGRATVEDRLGSNGSTTVSVYLVTDRNRDGSPVTGEPMSIFSYEFVLAAVDGTVRWGKYTNAQHNMNVPFGRFESPTEIYLGYGGLERLPAGKYKLGTLSFETLSGSPRLEFRSESSVYHYGGTTFGSMNSGKDMDNTLKYTENRARLQAPSDGKPGDWADADGVAATNGVAEPASEMTGAPAQRFEVHVGPNPSSAPGLRFTVSTTKPGRLVVRLFNVQGRLVRTLRSEQNAGPGPHVIELPSGQDRNLAAGIYLYRVEAADGIRTGRVVIVE